MGSWMWPLSPVVFAIFISLLFRPGDTQFVMQNPNNAGGFSVMQNPFMMSQPTTLQQQQMMRQGQMGGMSPQFMMSQPFFGQDFQGQQFQQFPATADGMMMMQGSPTQFGSFGQPMMNQQMLGTQESAEIPTATDQTATTASPPTDTSSKGSTAQDDKTASSPSTPAPISAVVDDSTVLRDDGARSLPNNGTIAPVSAPNTLPKSRLFQINANIFDPQSLATLKSQVKLTRFQIWWLTSQILKTVEDRLKPDYVFMMPSPFQQGIPSVNISQVLVTPLVRHEVMRSLIDAAPGMISSQLAVLLTRVRVSEPMIVKNIISSSDPRKLLSLINSRDLRKNIGVIIRTIMEMPETGRFGITSVQAKVLPKNILATWLKFSNITRWTAKDLTGQTPLAARLELELAILGLSCQDIRTLPPPDMPVVLSFLRRELYSVRAFQDIGFPMSLRYCMLQKVMEFLATKPPQNRNGHILDNLNPAEIKAIGGEVLSAIPIAALKNANLETQFFILSEIGRIDPISLTKFAPLKKLQWYGRTLFGEPEPDPLDAASISDSTESISGRSGGSDDESLIDDSGSMDQDKKNPDISGSEHTSSHSEAPAETKTPEDPAADAAKSGQADDKKPDANNPEHPRAVPDVLAPTDAQKSNLTDPAISAKDETAPKDRRRRLHSPEEEQASKLPRMGSLFCYSSSLLKATWESDSIKDLLESKDGFGDKTCCMTRSMRSQWNRLLKSTYGTNVTAWSEFDLAGVGDLLVALSDREIRSISMRNLSRVASTLIKQTGYLAQIEVPGKEKKVSFVDACMDMLGDDDEAETFKKAQKNYFRHLAHATQWMLTPEVTRVSKMTPTCDGIILAGPAATGYTLDDIQQMDTKAAFDCLEPITSLDWDRDSRQEMLSFFKEAFRLTSAQLNTLTLIELTNLVSELGPTDVSDIPFFLPDAMDSLSLLGAQITNPDTLKAVARKFSSDNRLLPGVIGIGRSINLKVVARSLGNILCGMNEQTVNTLLESDPTMLIETSPDLGRIQGCSSTMLQVLATHSIRPTNYGPPETWTSMDVRTLGVIVAGLPPEQLSRIPADSMEGLTPLAMQSFTAASLRALSPAQILAITADTAQAVDQTSAETLAPEQTDALKVVMAPGRDAFVVEPRIVKMAGGQQFTGLLGDADISSVSGDDAEEDAPAGPADPSEEASQDIDARAAGSEKGDNTTVIGPEFNSTSGLSDELSPENGTVHVVEVKENTTTTLPPETTSTSTTEAPPHQEGDVSNPEMSSAIYLSQNSYFITVSTIFTLVCTVIRNY